MASVVNSKCSCQQFYLVASVVFFLARFGLFESGLSSDASSSTVVERRRPIRARSQPKDVRDFASLRQPSAGISIESQRPWACERLALQHFQVEFNLTWHECVAHLLKWQQMRPQLLKWHLMRPRLACVGVCVRRVHRLQAFDSFVYNRPVVASYVQCGLFRKPLCGVLCTQRAPPFSVTLHICTQRAPTFGVTLHMCTQRAPPFRPFPLAGSVTDYILYVNVSNEPYPTQGSTSSTTMYFHRTPVPSCTEPSW
jgi:hypothetical protein